MKLLLISEFFPDLRDLTFAGGVEAREFFVARYLSKKNEVTVLTSRLAKQKKVEYFSGIKVIRVGKKRDYRATTGGILERISFIKSAVTEGLKVDAEIVEGSNFLTHFIAKEISRQKRIKSVAWYPDVWVGEWFKNAGIYGLFGEVLERLNLLRGFDGYIAISEQTAKKLRKRVSQEICVIPCGVEPKEFFDKEKRVGGEVVLSIGRLAAYKNHSVVIKAFSKIADRAELVIIGTGPMKKGLITLAQNLGIEDRVTFKESLARKEVIENIRSSRIFVSASLVEGFGISTIEACAAGVPFVISNIPIHREVTKKGLGGFLVNPANSNEFAKKVEELLTDKKLYLKKSREAKDLSSQYSWVEISKKTGAFFKSLMEEER